MTKMGCPWQVLKQWFPKQDAPHPAANSQSYGIRNSGDGVLDPCSREPFGCFGCVLPRGWRPEWKAMDAIDRSIFIRDLPCPTPPFLCLLPCQIIFSLKLITSLFRGAVPTSLLDRSGFAKSCRCPTLPRLPPPLLGILSAL